MHALETGRKHGICEHSVKGPGRQVAWPTSLAEAGRERSGERKGSEEGREGATGRRGRVGQRWKGKGKRSLGTVEDYLRRPVVPAKRIDRLSSLTLVVPRRSTQKTCPWPRLPGKGSPLTHTHTLTLSPLSHFQLQSLPCTTRPVEEERVAIGNIFVFYHLSLSLRACRWSMQVRAVQLHSVLILAAGSDTWSVNGCVLGGWWWNPSSWEQRDGHSTCSQSLDCLCGHVAQQWCNSDWWPTQLSDPSSDSAALTQALLLSLVWRLDVFFFIFFFSISLTTGGWNSPVTSCNTQIIMWYLWRRKITQPVAGSSRREKRDCGVNGAEGKEDQLIVVFTTDPSASTCTGIRFPQVLFLPSTLWVFTYLHNEEEREDVPSMVAVVRWRLPKRSCVIIVKPVAV